MGQTSSSSPSPINRQAYGAIERGINNKSLLSSLIPNWSLLISHFYHILDTHPTHVSNADTCRLLKLIHKVDIELLNSPVGSNNDTLLTLASSIGHTTVVSYLITRPDINITHVNMYGMSCMTLAVSRGHIDIVKLLLHTRGAMIRNDAVISAAIQRGQVTCLELILPFCDLYTTPSSGVRPLMEALNCYYWDCVTTLIAAGAPIEEVEERHIRSVPIYHRAYVDDAREKGQKLRDLILREIPPLVVDATNLPPIMAQIVLEYYSMLSRELRLREHSTHSTSPDEEDELVAITATATNKNGTPLHDRMIRGMNRAASVRMEEIQRSISNNYNSSTSTVM